MSETDRQERTKRIIYVDRIISIYTLVDLEDGYTPADINMGIIERVLRESGKEIEDIQVGVMEAKDGPITEIRTIFKTEEINNSVIRRLDNTIRSMNAVKSIRESITTSQLNETSFRARKRYDYVG